MLELKNIRKNYQVDGKNFPALKNVNLNFGSKGLVSILGPSGCGKTTLLNLIGGLDQYTSGDLIINNKSTKKFTDADWDAYRNKRVGFVFQSYNLIPHLNILGNVCISMTLSGISKREREKKALIALEKVGLKKVAKKRPNQLSGGQMQRVAIARSLVNNPEIILADEPTGALDSTTSIQVMDILKEVSQTRLVIMVTHNNELADKYSTRIIRLSDGRIVSDTKPDRSRKTNKNEVLEQEKNKHTHMSFFTALGNSFRNLLTKKGRTIMTSVAGSFGIIGVALVLAMSNGFQGYVGRVEAETASSVPITISPYVTTQIKQIDLPTPWPDEKVIKPYSEDITQLMVLHRNHLTKEYAEYTQGLLSKEHPYASSVLENHEYLDFNIYTEVAGSKDVIKVNQSQPAGAGGAILSGVTNLPSTIFHELYGGADYINSLYDVVQGKPLVDETIDPENPSCNLYLVCDRYNRIPLKTLKSLGIVKDTASEDQQVSFDDIINHEYKSYTPEQVLECSKKDDKDSTFSKILKENCYEFTNTYSDGENEYDLKHPDDDKTITQHWNIGDNEASSKQNRARLYATNATVNMKIAGILRPKKDTLINLMPGSVCYPKSLKEFYLNKVEQFYKKYWDTLTNNFYITNDFVESFIDGEIIKDPEVAAKIAAKYIVLEAAYAYNTGNPSSLYALLNNPDYFRFYGFYTSTYKQTSVDELTDFSYSFSQNYLPSNYNFMKEFNEVKFNKKEDEKYGYFYEPTGDFDFLDLVTYTSGYSPITSILIFPKSLSDKNNVFKYLDKYNEGLDEAQQILYSDLAGNLTTALGTMIDIISIVLICFSAVSLLVSCVMTGVITYTSVLERTKEIGILRAIGARKKDVGRLFEAESVIIGAVAGIVGTLFTFIVQWPISMIINARFPEQQIGMICNLNPLHALILILISILLTFVAGFIPARKASKKNPVEALRTE